MGLAPVGYWIRVGEEEEEEKVGVVIMFGLWQHSNTHSHSHPSHSPLNPFLSTCIHCTVSFIRTTSIVPSSFHFRHAKNRYGCPSPPRIYNLAFLTLTKIYNPLLLNTWPHLQWGERYAPSTNTATSSHNNNLLHLNPPYPPLPSNTHADKKEDSPYLPFK